MLSQLFCTLQFQLKNVHLSRNANQLSFYSTFCTKRCWEVCSGLMDSQNGTAHNQKRHKYSQMSGHTDELKSKKIRAG